MPELDGRKNICTLSLETRGLCADLVERRVKAGPGFYSCAPSSSAMRMLLRWRAGFHSCEVVRLAGVEPATCRLGVGGRRLVLVSKVMKNNKKILGQGAASR